MLNGRAMAQSSPQCSKAKRGLLATAPTLVSKNMKCLIAIKYFKKNLFKTL